MERGKTGEDKSGSEACRSRPASISRAGLFVGLKFADFVTANYALAILGGEPIR
jgi:hypothetical protein